MTSTATRQAMDSTALRTKTGSSPIANRRSRPGVRQRDASSERGFTLAAVLVIMSVMLIFIAYTVPQQWSLVMRRERELQTIFLMQQYAKACQAFMDKNKTYPVSMQQLAEAVQPRFLRCPKDGCIDPLTGEVDWYVIPQSQAPAPSGGQTPAGVVPPAGGPTGTQATSTAAP